MTNPKEQKMPKKKKYFSIGEGINNTRPLIVEHSESGLRDIWDCLFDQECDEPDTLFTLKVVEMTEDEFKNIEEWDGF